MRHQDYLIDPDLSDVQEERVVEVVDARGNIISSMALPSSAVTFEFPFLCNELGPHTVRLRQGWIRRKRDEGVG